MADVITTVSSALPKTNINTTISTSSFTAPVSNTIIDDITLNNDESIHYFSKNNFNKL